jgi:flagellin-like hook-associated protein FlgL
MTAEDATGNPIFGNTVNQVQIEPNVMVESGVKFTDAFGSGGDLTYPENSEMYLNIQKFVTYLDEKGQNTGLTTQTADQVSAGLNTSFDQLTMAEQRSGGIAAQVDNAKSAMSAFGVQMAAAQSALLDTDMAAATASYTRAQTLLNAAQAMFARLQQSNLFSKL